MGVEAATIEPLLARLRAVNGYPDIKKDATSHRNAEADNLRAELLRVRARQEVDEHCRERASFLEGPRFLRDKFGSVLNRTDRTSDAVLEDCIAMRSDALAFSAELCRRAHEARTWSVEVDPSASPPPSP